MSTPPGLERQATVEAVKLSKKLLSGVDDLGKGLQLLGKELDAPARIAGSKAQEAIQNYLRYCSQIGKSPVKSEALQFARREVYQVLSKLRSEVVAKLAEQARIAAEQAARAAAQAKKTEAAASAAQKAKTAAEGANKTKQAARAAANTKKAADAAKKTASGVGGAKKSAEAAARSAGRAKEAVKAVVRVGDTAIDTSRGYVTASEAAGAGLKVSEVTSKTGQILKYVRVAGKVLLVLGAMYEVYNAYDQFRELQEALKAESKEAKEQYGEDTMITRMRVADDTVADLGARERAQIAASAEKVMNQEERDKLLISARNFSLRLQLDLEMYRQHRRVDDKTKMGYLDWVGEKATDVIAYAGGMNTGKIDQKMDREEDANINSRIDELGKIRQKLFKTEPRTDSVNASIRYIDELVHKAKEVMQRQKRLDEAELRELRKLKKEAIKKHRAERLFEKKKDELINIVARISKKLEKPGLDPEKVEIMSAALSKIGDPEKISKADLDIMLDEVKKIEKEVDLISVVSNIPQIIVGEVMHRLKNSQHSGTIPYQGVDYRFEYDQKTKKVKIKSSPDADPKEYVFDGKFGSEVKAEESNEDKISTAQDSGEDRDYIDVPKS
ncbi:hypothetical protein GF376_03120 [Candidatus Peregrinibacteria bacterium]|nr:hypothetical protein [Candidatus Peregrinibacteria bacterium]